MKIGELIPIPKHFLSKSTVPAGISFGIKQATGETSKSSPRTNKFRFGVIELDVMLQPSQV